MNAAKRKEDQKVKEQIKKEDQKIKRARVDVKKDTVRGSLGMKNSTPDRTPFAVQKEACIVLVNHCLERCRHNVPALALHECQHQHSCRGLSF